ncbi:MAG: hypothetical protein JNJ99_11315 [Crocinitomicaceae bacterium]|nr:hypothetical protein [Crocinitomicaceae bacterium]
MNTGTNTNELGTVKYSYVDKEGNPVNVRRDYSGEYVHGSNEVMPLGQDNLFGSIYIGPTNPSAIVNGVEIADYRREPLNELDLAAYNHDKEYDLCGAAGFSGATGSPSTIEADLQLVIDAKIVAAKYEKGLTDSVTGEQVTFSDAFNAAIVVNTFEFLIDRKKMIRNDIIIIPGDENDPYDRFEKKDNTNVQTNQ